MVANSFLNPTPYARDTISEGFQQEDIIVSTGFAVITPTKIDPIVLFAILKTESVFSQLVRNSRAAMYPAVTDDDIPNILIPELSEKQTEQVIPFVEESLSLRRQSDLLLHEFHQLGENALNNQ